MTKYKGKRGAAWNGQVFNGTPLARKGGPVRRHIGSIDQNSSRWKLYRAAKRRRWSIVEVGSHWIIFDPAKGYRQVLGPPPVRRVPSSRP